MMELVSRIKAVLRRTQKNTKDTLYRIENLELDIEKRRSCRSLDGTRRDFDAKRIRNAGEDW